MAKRTDGNQAEIVQALRRVGCTVQDLHAVGHGCPDVVVGRAGQTYLLEIKNGDRARLNSREQRWHNEWRGQVAVVRTVEDALRAVGIFIA